MTYPSNARGNDPLDFGMLNGVAEICMYYAPDQAAAFREWLASGAKYAHLTHRTDAYTATYVIRVNGDNLGVLVNYPANPDIQDPTDPANAPVDTGFNPDAEGINRGVLNS